MSNFQYPVIVTAYNVFGLDIPQSDKPFFQFGDFHLFHDQSLYNSFTSRDIDHFGLIKLDRFKGPYLLGLMQQEHAFRKYETSTIEGHRHLLCNALNAMLSYLWFVKDNAVCGSCLLVEVQVDGVNTDNNKLTMEERQERFSTATGEYVNTSFTKEELEKGFAFYKVANRVMKNQIYDSNMELKEVNRIANRNPLHELNYNIFSRIERSLNFLIMARSFSFLPYKITFYVAILECLFSAENTEIAHKVSERSALYLGGDKERKLANYNLVKDAYTLRSDYIHGSELTPKIIKKYDGLKNVSVLVDNLIREVLSNVITKDLEKFLLPDKKFKEWHASLLFTNDGSVS